MRPGRGYGAAGGVLAVLALSAPVAVAAGAAWEQWLHVPGIFDVSGPRADGRLVAAGSGRLYLVDTSGTFVPFAAGRQGYSDGGGGEAYLSVSPGLHVQSAGCDFARDDVFVLRLQKPIGVTRIDASGTAAPFASVPGVESLGGIAFDTTGRFGSRLLVSGPANGRTTIAAIDCRGGVQVITSSAPVLEGGLAVAPATFGAFGGALIAPDELSGRLWAIGADGQATLVANSGLPTGGDIGVESVAFVPPGFTAAGGAVYYPDRATSNNPHPGTDSLLRLPARDLRQVGVQDGDMLAATEGGASLISVHCAGSCRITPVVTAPTSAHGEGHLAVVAGAPVNSRPAPAGTLPTAAVVAVVAVLLLGAAAGAAVVLSRRR
jgi:hypothetical protein